MHTSSTEMRVENQGFILKPVESFQAKVGKRIGVIS